MSFLNQPILCYADEIRSVVLVMHGEKAHLQHMGFLVPLRAVMEGGQRHPAILHRRDALRLPLPYAGTLVLRHREQRLEQGITEYRNTPRWPLWAGGDFLTEALDRYGEIHLGYPNYSSLLCARAYQIIFKVSNKFLAVGISKEPYLPSLSSKIALIPTAFAPFISDVTESPI